MNLSYPGQYGHALEVQRGEDALTLDLHGRAGRRALADDDHALDLGEDERSGDPGHVLLLDLLAYPRPRPRTAPSWAATTATGEDVLALDLLGQAELCSTSMNGEENPRTGLNHQYADDHAALVGRIEATDGLHLQRIHRKCRKRAVAGYYRPPDERKRISIIEIYSEDADVIDDYLDELMTLAHELGHHLSYVEKERPSDYTNIITCFEDADYSRGNLSDTECNTILDEERRAWTYAQDILAEVCSQPFEDSFVRRRDESLAKYCERLRLPFKP